MGEFDFLARLETCMSAVDGRPSWDEYFMAVAQLIASRSPCQRLHVGCVLVSTNGNSNRIIAAGYNGFLPGAPHLSYVRDDHEQLTVHAEQNAVADAARRGISVDRSAAYVTHFPCINCVKILIAAGVKSIKYWRDYRNDDLVLRILKGQGVGIVRLGK